MTGRSEKYPAKGKGERGEAAEDLSRRDFLSTAGIAAAGGLVVAAGGSILADREATAATAPAAPPLPWKYTKLDPLEAGKRGYKSYLANGG